MPSISRSHLSLLLGLVSPGCLCSSLRLSFFKGNVPAFLYHFLSSCFPLPFLICSLLLDVMSSRKRREFNLAGSLECPIPSLGFHHFQRAASGSLLYPHLVWERCSFFKVTRLRWGKLAEVTNWRLRRQGLVENLVEVFWV